MAFAGGGLNSPSARDTAPGPRFFVFAVLSILLMYFDQRDGWSQRIRYVLQGAAYPVQVAVGSPRLLWNSTIDLFSTRATLRREKGHDIAAACGLPAPRASSTPIALSLARAWSRERGLGEGAWRTDIVRRARSSQFDVSRASHDLGWKARVSVEDGMRSLAEWVTSKGGAKAIATTARALAS